MAINVLKIVLIRESSNTKIDRPRHKRKKKKKRAGEQMYNIEKTSQILGGTKMRKPTSKAKKDKEKKKKKKLTW